jgi:aminoglycoside phosphotransferase (APT) family kinase protein
MEQWLSAAAWIARFHAATARQTGIEPAGPWVRYDAAFYWQWLRRAAAFCRNRGGGTRDQQELIRRLEAHYGRVVDRLLALPCTMIHGELYASNIIVKSGNGGARICPVDWETTAIGPGLIDLAALTAGRWTDLQQARIARAYYEAREPRPDQARSSFDRFLSDLAVCRLHLAVLRLGWAERWEPPREHEYDWWGETRRLADQLGL